MHQKREGRHREKGVGSMLQDPLPRAIEALTRGPILIEGKGVRGVSRPKSAAIPTR
jgi:hypothetical protein